MENKKLLPDMFGVMPISSTNSIGGFLMATKPVKLPSGAWRVRVEIPDSPDGKRHYKSFTNTDKKMAVHLAAQYEALQKEQHDPANMTVGAAVDAYISARTAVLSPTTLRAYKANRKANFSAIEHTKLRALTSRAVQSWVNVLSASHSPKTVRNIYALFTAVLREAHPDFHPRVNLPARKHTEITIPSKADVSALLSAAQGTVLESAILLAAGYGLRRGEVCALTLSDMDDKALTVTVNKSLARTSSNENRWVLKAPKSFAGSRTLPVSANLIDRVRHNTPKGQERVCPMSPDDLTRHFGALCASVGVQTHFHALRHYNASIMLSLNVPDKYQMQRLGQSTPGLVKAVYQHIMASKQDEVTDAINTAFESLL